MHEKLSNHQVESTRELWELADWCARAEEGAKFPGDDDPEDEAAPSKNKKRTPGPEKRVFVTEPLPKKAKPVSASDGEGHPWCHIHPDGNHTLKDCRQMKNLAIREQRRADGVSLDGCYNSGVIGHISRECPSGRQGGGGRGWGRGGGRGGRGGGRGPPGAREQDNQDVVPAANQGAPGGNNGKF